MSFTENFPIQIIICIIKGNDHVWTFLIIKNGWNLYEYLPSNTLFSGIKSIHFCPFVFKHSIFIVTFFNKTLNLFTNPTKEGKWNNMKNPWKLYPIWADLVVSLCSDVLPPAIEMIYINAYDWIINKTVNVGTIDIIEIKLLGITPPLTLFLMKWFVWNSNWTSLKHFPFLSFEDFSLMLSQYLAKYLSLSADERNPLLALLLLLCIPPCVCCCYGKKILKKCRTPKTTTTTTTNVSAVKLESQNPLLASSPGHMNPEAPAAPGNILAHSTSHTPWAFKKLFKYKISKLKEKISKLHFSISFIFLMFYCAHIPFCFFCVSLCTPSVNLDLAICEEYCYRNIIKKWMMSWNPTKGEVTVTWSWLFFNNSFANSKKFNCINKQYGRLLTFNSFV